MDSAPLVNTFNSQINNHPIRPLFCCFVGSGGDLGAVNSLFKMLIPTPGSRRRGSAQTRASRRTRSGTVADSEEERSALPTAGTWPAIEAGHRDSLLYSGGKNPRDSAATQASAHHHTHHIEADGTHTSKQDTAAQHTRTASHTTPSSPKLPGGSPAPQSVVALHSMRSGSKEAGSAAGP